LDIATIYDNKSPLEMKHTCPTNRNDNMRRNIQLGIDLRLAGVNDGAADRHEKRM